MGRTEDPDGGRLFTDLDRGWSWVVLVASFVSLMMIGTSIYAVGIIHIALLERYEQDVSRTAWVGSVHSAMIAAAGRYRLSGCVNINEPPRGKTNNVVFE